MAGAWRQHASAFTPQVFPVSGHLSMKGTVHASELSVTNVTGLVIYWLLNHPLY